MNGLRILLGGALVAGLALQAPWAIFWAVFGLLAAGRPSKDSGLWA